MAWGAFSNLVVELPEGKVPRVLRVAVENGKEEICLIGMGLGCRVGEPLRTPGPSRGGTSA